MREVKISIILPLYNKAIYIKDVLNSILSQSFTDFEVIVIDDGSTDESAQIVESFVDDRIHLFKKENGGVSSARNYGLNKCIGDLIYYLDGDDLMDPQALSTLYNLYLSHSDCDVFAGNFLQVYSNIKPKQYCKGDEEYVVVNNYEDFYSQKIYMRAGIFIIKRDALLKTEGFNENLSKGEDLDFFFRLMSFCKIAYTPKVVYQYIKGASELSKKTIRFDKTIISVIRLEARHDYFNKIQADIVVGEMLNMLVSRDFRRLWFLIMRFKKSWLLLLSEIPHSLYSIFCNSCIKQRLINKLKL
jgi:glycosyltransferase involved in cell wall biosynthesis